MKQRINSVLREELPGQHLVVQGWVRTRRDTGTFSFLEVNDGSSLANLQVIADQSLVNYQTEIKRLTTGCAVRVVGVTRTSPAKGQKVELHAEEVEVVGWADPENYPLQKKRHSLEFLREITHLRPRTNALGAVARVRSRLAWAINGFFQERGFVQVHTPIITTSDCEGAGEMFQVSTFRDQRDAAREPEEFFGRRAGLTVSGQLQAEVYALSLGNVYTFGPTFRAENSNTTRHLAEFWMIEPEMAFCDLACNMAVATDLLKSVLADVVEYCAEDMTLFDSFIEKGLLAKLHSVIDKEFAHITYTEAVDRLLAAKTSFEFPVSWGSDLQSEHERYLSEELFGCPVIVTDYPAGIKPFYMRQNDDGGQTVAAMDILVPGIGELVGGSQREERYEVLEQRMIAAGIDLADYRWYLDLRRYGSVPHSGFGLGFERLVQFVTGMANIRDVIPFPRTPGFAPC
ncbi:MAG: asparagine--tRNA ligase [Desulfopila sp.]